MAKKIEIKKLSPTPTGPTKSSDRNAPVTTSFALGKENYMFILAGIGLLAIGYVLMIGGGADSPDKYNPEIFNTQRLTVAPITLLIGFGVVLFGIMKKPKVQE